MLPLLLLPLSVGSEPPAFVVTNRVPPFVVVNKVGPKPAGPTLNAEGVPADPAPPGHRCHSWPGENWKLVKVAAAPGVAAPQTFRTQPARGGPVRHEGHDCPQCGYQSPAGAGTWVIRGYTPGGHLHSCPQCSASWVH